MEFAIVNNQKVKPASGLRGVCQLCLQPVIAKCGNERIHHWAHHGEKPCPYSREAETEWHRSWKDKFPEPWHEVCLIDEGTGDRHRADIQTPDGLVVEFQNSPIHLDECVSRERFHQKMVWVVNGTRLENDHKRFVKGEFRLISKGVFRSSIECFPKAWRESSVAVIFDFKDTDSIDDSDDLYLLFPKRLGGDAIVAVVSRRAFIDAVSSDKLMGWVQATIKNIIQVDQELKHQREIQERQQTNLMFQRLTRAAWIARSKKRRWR